MKRKEDTNCVIKLTRSQEMEREIQDAQRQHENAEKQREASEKIGKLI